MTQFEDRERAYEAHFALDEELRFKALARRNRLFGEWAAGQLGRTGADAEAYAKEVVRADFEKPGDDDVLLKVKRDFDAAGVPATEAELRGKMSELLAAAVQQIAS